MSLKTISKNFPLLFAHNHEFQFAWNDFLRGAEMWTQGIAFISADKWGNPNVGDTVIGLTGGAVHLSLFDLYFEVDITKFTVDVDANVTTNVKAVVYNEVNGEPDALVLTSNEITSVTAGWQDITIPATTRFYPGAYFIGTHQSTTFNTNKHSDVLYQRSRGDTISYGSGPPDPWLTASDFDLSHQMAMYGTQSLLSNTMVLDDRAAGAQIIMLTGALTANLTVEVPARPALFIFDNQTTGAFSVTVKINGGLGSTVTQGESAWLFNDGSDVYPAAGSGVSKL